MEEESDKRKKERLMIGNCFYFSKIGLCGLDDSTNLNFFLPVLVPSWIEFGFLFYPEREGKPRYATMKWLKEKFIPKFKSTHRFAAHFCSSRCEEVLTNNVDVEFMEQLYSLGFRRIQLNATKMNGFDSSKLKEINAFSNLLKIATKYPQFEFIIQMNDETKALWQPLFVLEEDKRKENISILLDASIGTGLRINSFQPPQSFEKINLLKYGYAGGINPDNVKDIIFEIIEANSNNNKHKFIWLDMESGIRNKVDDSVNVDKILKIIATCEELEEKKKIGFI